MTGRSKGFGFCRFGDEGERDRAIVEMAGHFINNRPIRVSTATARKAPSVPFPPNPADRESPPFQRHAGVQLLDQGGLW